jgi:hypothetical protein
MRETKEIYGLVKLNVMIVFSKQVRTNRHSLEEEVSESEPIKARRLEEN